MFNQDVRDVPVVNKLPPMPPIVVNPLQARETMLTELSEKESLLPNIATRRSVKLLDKLIS